MSECVLYVVCCCPLAKIILLRVFSCQQSQETQECPNKFKLSELLEENNSLKLGNFNCLKI